MLERSTSLVAIVLTLVVGSAAALAEEEEEEKKLVKSGSFEVENVRASFMGSAGFSTGKLEYAGKSRKFKVVGLGIGGIGVSRTRAWGGVYNMKKLEDFTGKYVMFRSGVAVGDEEVGNKRWVENDKGVKLELNLDTDGLQLNLGADGMVVTWDE